MFVLCQFDFYGRLDILHFSITILSHIKNGRHDHILKPLSINLIRNHSNKSYIYLFLQYLHHFIYIFFFLNFKFLHESNLFDWSYHFWLSKHLIKQKNCLLDYKYYRNNFFGKCLCFVHSMLTHEIQRIYLITKLAITTSILALIWMNLKFNKCLGIATV